MIKKLLNVSVLVSLLLTLVVNALPVSPVATAKAATVAPASNYVAGQVIVKFKSGVLPTTLFLSKYGLQSPDKILSRVTLSGAMQASVQQYGLDRVYIMKTTNASLDIKALVATLATDLGIEYAEPNFIYTVQSGDPPPPCDPLTSTVPCDPFYRNNTQRALSAGGQYNGPVTEMTSNISNAPLAYQANIGFQQAWNSVNSQNPNYDSIQVAIIDTGVDSTHPDLAGAVVSNYNYNAIDGGTNITDNDGHGTAIAGIIGARTNSIGIVGVNWRAKFIAIKAFEANNSPISSDPTQPSASGDIASILRALAYAGSSSAKVINCSWGGRDYSNVLLEMFKAVQNAKSNILFIAAAGNARRDMPISVNNELFHNTIGIDNNNDTYPFYPASYPLPSIIAVAATDDKDVAPAWSQHGTVSVHLGAPGVDIISTAPMTKCADSVEGCYSYNDGTSYSTAFVTGAVSLFWSIDTEDKGWTALKVKDQLLKFTDKIPALVGLVSSGGRLNIANMLQGDCLIPVSNPVDSVYCIPNSTYLTPRI